MNKKGEMPVNLLVTLIILFLLFLAATILYVALTGKSDGLVDGFTKVVGWD
ncbi:MAG TPA: hypothetical protein VJI32_07180 [Candidatus Nanoarchaeia archaeon]|nr:hypothetical protein [Candidatus Nanoarchaeia archaeon]